MNNYTYLKDRHQQEINAFPIFFAFNDKQFAEGMTKLGLQPDETDKIYKLGNIGGFYRKSDGPQLHEMFNRHERERHEAISGDTTGDGYIYQMFLYELANHEYGYTRDITNTLEALSLMPEDIEKSKALKHGLVRAIKEIEEYEETT